MTPRTSTLLSACESPGHVVGEDLRAINERMRSPLRKRLFVDETAVPAPTELPSSSPNTVISRRLQELRGGHV